MLVRPAHPVTRSTRGGPIAPPYSRGCDFDRLGEGVDHASLPLDERPTDIGRLRDAHEVMGPQHGPLTEDCDTEVADLVVDLLDPLRARGDRLGRANTSLVVGS